MLKEIKKSLMEFALETPLEIATQKRQRRQILPFVLIITLMTFGFHYMIAQIANNRPWFGTSGRNLVTVMAFLGPMFVLTSFFIGNSRLRKTLKKVQTLGYSWLGFYNFWFWGSLVECLAQIIYPHDGSELFLYIGVGLGTLALFNGHRLPMVRHHRLLAPPELKGIKIVQISDLHIGMAHLNQEWLNAVVGKIKTLAPDFLVVTGDLVEGPFAEVIPMLAPLKDIEPKLMKLFVTGNHEYIHGGSRWEEVLGDHGFKVLHNSSVVVPIAGATIGVAGVPDRMVRRFENHLESNPQKALREIHSCNYRILLAHEPASVLDLNGEACELILSGHTHGGQIFPFGILVRLAQPVVSGFKKFGSTLVYAHVGTGFWGPPMRLGSKSEIAVFEFVTENASAII